ncbi:hypothetical protein F3J20_16125 [Paraburkholderia sp. Cy-641]|uniref:hypothetical protein n=1 Tax=Paraburkholderia sp. Cy-641 TaxID=2608337 RepID=UPI0014249BAC|nr:hypothetical protein [Paraburkholderia sp. Cy-641]NIF78895.1 hypothetical protein [Paraburkholderia sp. Cy-641]
MINSQTTVAIASDQLTVRISRAAYEMIRLSDDRRVMGARAVVPLKGVSVELTLSQIQAEELKSWAQELWDGAQRGQRKTLSSLQTALIFAIRDHRARGCIPDPGKAAILEARAGGARLQIGDVVLDENNDLVQIVSGPDFYVVTDEHGIYIDKCGSRFNWRYGYCAALCEEGGIFAKRKFFYAPYRLWSKDNGITYLKLVYDAGSQHA